MLSPANILLSRTKNYDYAELPRFIPGLATSQRQILGVPRTPILRTTNRTVVVLFPSFDFSTFSHHPPYPSLFIFPSIVDSPPLVNLWYYAFLTQICAFFPLRLSTRVIDVCCYAQVLLLMAVYRICFYTRSNSDYCTALLGLIRIEYEYFQQHSAATF